MTTPDQPFYRALLYLRVAGHDTGAETRVRLQKCLRAHLDEHPALETDHLLARIPQWFDLPRANRGHLHPPVTRSSIGYSDE